MKTGELTLQELLPSLAFPQVNAAVNLLFSVQYALYTWFTVAIIQMLQVFNRWCLSNLKGETIMVIVKV